MNRRTAFGVAAASLLGAVLPMEQPAFRTMRINIWNEPRLDTVNFALHGIEWRVMLIYSDKTQERLLAKEVSLSGALGLVGKPKRYVQERLALAFVSAHYCS